VLHIKLPKGKAGRAFEACGEYHETRAFGAREAAKMFRHANACTFSVGDVYIEADLFMQIREFYREVN